MPPPSASSSWSATYRPTMPILRLRKTRDHERRGRATTDRKVLVLTYDGGPHESPCNAGLQLTGGIRRTCSALRLACRNNADSGRSAVLASCGVEPADGAAYRRLGRRARARSRRAPATTVGVAVGSARQSPRARASQTPPWVRWAAPSANLALREKAHEEHAQPLAYRGQVVRVPRLRSCGGHGSRARRRATRAMRGNATFDGGSEARDVVEVEVLRLVGTDHRLRALDRALRTTAISRCRRSTGSRARWPRRTGGFSPPSA